MRRSAVAAVALVIALIVVFAANVLMMRVGARTLGDLFYFTSVASFTLVGALIVWKQPANRIGWLFAAVGLLWLTGDFASSYAYYAVVLSDNSPPLATLAAWYGEFFWLLWLVSMFSLVPLLFPTGRPLSPRWGMVTRIVCVYLAVAVGAAMFESELDIVGSQKVLSNPIGISGFRDIESGVWAIPLFVALMAALVAGLAGVVARFRRSRGEERQQLKWFAFAATTLILEFIAQIALDAVFGYRVPVLDAVVVLLVPASAAVAILKYRLYDIDVVINRTLVYGALTAVLAGVYVGLVFGFQALLRPFTAESDLAIAASTLAVAGLFRPVRARLQSFIDHRFYRRKFDAQQTLERFTLRLRDEVDLGNLSAELATVVGETVQPAHVSLWLRRPETSS